jgi:nucleoid-associated protein YgaU
MNRIRVLITAGLIVLVGLAFAWFFRQDPSADAPGPPLEPDVESLARLAPAVAEPLPTGPVASAPQTLAAADPPPVAVQPQAPLTPDPALRDESSRAPSSPMSLADLDQRPLAPLPPSFPDLPESREPGQEAGGGTVAVRPTLPGSSSEGGPAAGVRTIHVVADGDTLEGLAKLYLGDPARAMEIFDANRETLLSPELLPIGARLIIPDRDSPADPGPGGESQGKLIPVARPD